MKKLFKGTFKVVGIAAVIYGIWNTLVHLWISTSRIIRQMRLQKEEMNERGFIQNIDKINTAVINEAEEEWRLFKEECITK